MWSKRDRPGASGIALGIAAGLKLWGGLGLPLLLLVPRASRAASALVIAAATSVSMYLPFILGGNFRSFDYTWTVRAQSPVRLLLGVESRFTWPMRLGQSALVVAGGVAMVLWARRRSSVVWTGPFAMIALRLLTDPLDYHYYWLPAGIVALVGLSSVVTHRPSSIRVPLAAGYYLTSIPFFVLKGGALAVWIAGAALALIGAVIRGVLFSAPARMSRAPA